jgi:shikimate dehydrogenase
MKKKVYGLVGFPLEHSFSKKHFLTKFIREALFDCVYDNFEYPRIEDVKTLFNNGLLLGFNVTIPYKKQIQPFLDEIDPIASTIGAVNCVKRNGNKWKGFNTDAFGFENSLKPLLHSHHHHALILGTGGAAASVAFALTKLGVEFTSVSSQEKEGTISYYDLDEFVLQEHMLIINTTPLGTYPEENECPQIPYGYLTDKHLCYDLIYNPAETLFLKKSKRYGAQIKNGYEMLVLQAEESWRIWNDPSV